MVYFGKKSHIGTLDCNSNLGIYGQLDSDELSEYAAEDTYYPVAGKDEIHTGSAQMISEISGKLEKYNLEITNIDKKATDTNKGMELKVTDDRLIELSGGIVQGTSGSPIIQDGKIIGAVTHVFVDDPTGATASALMRCCNYCSICEAQVAQCQAWLQSRCFRQSRLIQLCHKHTVGSHTKGVRQNICQRYNDEHLAKQGEKYSPLLFCSVI